MKLLPKIISLILVSVMLFSLSACGAGNEETKEDETIEGLLAIQPLYIGESVTETNHEFKKSDFRVTAIFDDNSSRIVTDYRFEIDSMAQGLYVINFFYGGEENTLYVPIDLNFFPTDRETYGG